MVPGKKARALRAGSSKNAQVVLRWQNKKAGMVPSKTAPSLRAHEAAGTRQPVVVNRGNLRTTGGIALAIDANYWKGLDAHGQRTAILEAYETGELTLRRLTPTECMRLMAWPDRHCDIGVIDGQQVRMSDTAKYRQAGNGIVASVVEAVIRNLIPAWPKR